MALIAMAEFVKRFEMELIFQMEGIILKRNYKLVDE